MPRSHKRWEKLEEELGIGAQEGGQFTKRPREVAHLINEPFAADVTYPAVLAAWIFLALLFKSPDALWWAIGVFIVGFAVVLFFNLKLKMGEDICKVLEDIREELTMREEKLTIPDWWKYLRLKKEQDILKKEDIRDPEVMNGKLVFAGTDVEVKTLIDYLKNDRTLDDFLEKYPTVSRRQAETYLEMALQAAGEKTSSSVNK